MNIKESKAIALLLCLVAICATFSAFAQTSPSNHTSDPYSVTIEHRDCKPELQYFQVRLKGDNGVSLIDINGNIIARNFTPVTNSQGKVACANQTNPVINDIFCVVRYKHDSDWELRPSHTIYHNASSPTPIPGLTDLYDANIINPNLFPISRYGERIKFADKNGKEKFTVMPIDGKEPDSVSPIATNGILLVKVDNGKYGAINTTGKWVIYPEWNDISVLIDGTILGLKDKGEIYKITLTDKLSHATRFEIPIDFYDYSRSYGRKYLIEEFYDNGERVSNIYDRDNKYITTLNNTDYVWPNRTHPDLLLVRKNFKSGMDSSECLIDISKNNAVVSKYYSEMNELPDGNYLAHNRTSKSDVNRCWYVKADGTETALPNNTEFPLCHPGMALLYRGTVKNFFVEATAGKCGYICDSMGNKVGYLEIEEYYNSSWEAEPVNSSYYRINILDKNNQ